MAGNGELGITIDGDNATRLFHVVSGATANLNRLTLTRGYGDEGGAIDNRGTLSVMGSTLSHNTAYDGLGGAILNYLSASLTVITGTLVGNAAIMGGGIFTAPNSTLTVTSSTPTGNVASDRGGGTGRQGGTVSLQNTLVVGNFAEEGGDDVFGDITDNGGNLIGVPSGVTLGQIIKLDSENKPLLADNGGPTMTVALVPGSLAIAAGAAIDGLTTDQRGRSRNATPDIGAFETQTPTFIITTGGGTYNGSAFGVTNATVVGLSDVTLAQLGDASLSFTYFASDDSVLSGAPKNVGEYTAVAHFTSDVIGYRNASSSPASFTITPATLIVTASGINKVYDGGTGASVTLEDNRVAGDELEVTYAAAAFDNKNAGNNKAVSVSGIQVSRAAAGNYTFNTTAATTADITPREATWNTNNSGKVFGVADPDPLTTGTGDGFLAADEVFASYAREAGEEGDDYDLFAILGSNVLSAAELANNYAITNQGATFTIAQATTGLSLSVSSASPLFGVDAVTLSVDVALLTGAGQPSGTVDFYNGETLLGSVDLIGGTASLNLESTLLAGGTHTLRAVYVDANGNYAGSEGTVDVSVVPPTSIQGLVYIDANNNGEVDLGEAGVAGVTITLTGLDDLGQPVTRTTQTDSHGVYTFANLRPSSSAGYTITQTQPSDLLDGIHSVGTVDGTPIGEAGKDAVGNDVFTSVVVAGGQHGENYNFGERQAVTTGVVRRGDTAGIGFWQNKNGQTLITSLNGGANATQLGNWLAQNFDNLYSHLAGKTNAQVAAYHKTLFALNGKTGVGGPPKTDAQVLAAALAVYVTRQSLAGPVAASYGFNVTDTGTGSRTWNVGSHGAVFGVSNNSHVAIIDLLVAVNAGSHNGWVFDTNGDGQISSVEKGLRTAANNLFTAIKEAGGI